MRTLSKPTPKWYDINEIDLQEVGCGRMNCIGLCQDREIGLLGGNIPLSKPRRKFDDIIEIDFQDMGCGRMD